MPPSITEDFRHGETDVCSITEDFRHDALQSHLLISYLNGLTSNRFNAYGWFDSRGLNQGSFDSSKEIQFHAREPTNNVKILTKAHDYDAIKNYPAFLQFLKDRMQNMDLTLDTAMFDHEHDGKFNVISQRSVGQSKLQLAEKVQPLQFRAPLPGELIGAESKDNELRVGVLSRRNSVIAVLESIPAQSAEDAVSSTDVAEELKTGAFDEFSPPDEPASEMTTPEITTLLTDLAETCGHREPVVIRVYSKAKRRRPLFYLNEKGISSIRNTFLACPTSPNLQQLFPLDLGGIAAHRSFGIGAEMHSHNWPMVVSHDVYLAENYLTPFRFNA
jgi:hypothetical protein